MVFMLGSFPDLAQQELLGFRRAGSQSIGTGDGKLFVLLRGGGAADAHGPDDLPVDDDRNAALERREIIERCHGGPAFVDHVFEELRRPFEQDGSPCLADGNIGSGSEGIIQPLDGDEITAFVDDGDGSTGRVLTLRLGDCGRDYFFAPSKVKPFFCMVCAELMEENVSAISIPSALMMSFIDFAPNCK